MQTTPMTAGRSLPEGLAARRAEVVAEAESWIGTPYRHRHAAKGTGCDCLGLVRGVWRALFGNEPMALPDYSPDWAEAGAEDRLLDAARTLCLAHESLVPLPGQIVLFRWRAHLPAKHLGIMGTGGRLVHAYDTHGVVASPLAPAWSRRIAGVFDFPFTD